MAGAPERFDAIVIGSGQGGKPLARAFAQAGRRTAVVEREEKIGGTCIVDGCTPTKTMVASARVAHLVGRAGDYGVEVAEARVDLARVRERKRAIVDKFSGGSRKGLERQPGLELVFGEARFTAPKTIDVALCGGGRRRMTAETIVIDTGLRPRIPEIEGIDRVPYLTNRTIMELDAVPDHLAVVGGGYIGLEFGQMFRRFGARVTILQRSARLLPREDEDVSEAVAAILAEDGIDLRFETRTVRVREAAGTLELDLEGPGGAARLEASHLLLAAGRVPSTEGLGLEAAGVETDERGFVRTNERLETTAPGVYAIGDVKGGPAFTHISYDDYRILEENLLRGGRATIENRLVPYTLYIDPELGRVGPTEREARATGRPIRVARLPMSHVARALESDETRGFMKAIVDAEKKAILGCAILGVHGGEIMSVLEVAMMGGLPYTALRDAVFAHPTLAESLNNLFMTLDD